MGGGDNLIPLTKGSVLYLGSAVPLETSVGLEALQRPLRDRYLTGDPGQKVSAIDAVLTIFSGGILMQYPGDDSSSTWFPMQTLHMCAAVKAAGGTFVSVDSPQALGSREPPIFAVIARRSRGVKVLECHVFVCRSTEAALGFVQSCTHAFQHREGWTDGLPVASASARIVAAAADCSSAGSDLGSQARTQLQGFMYSPDQQVGMYNISGMEPPRPAPAPVQTPAPAPVPAPAPPSVQVIQQSPAVQVIQQPSAGGQPFQYITMNPPGAPVAQVPQISMVPQVPQISMVPQVPMGPQVPQMPRGPQMMVPQGYFADWDQNYGMTMMVVPNSPFYPGDEAYNKENTKNKKKHKKHKKKNKRKSKKYEEEAEEDEEEEEEEFFYVRRSRFPQGQLPPDFVEVPSQTQPRPSNRYSTGQSEMRYVSEPMRPAPPPPQHSTTEIHYVPIPNTTTSYREILPQENDFPPPDLNDGSTTDIFLAKVNPPAPKPAGAYYYFEDQGPPEFQLGGGGGGGGGGYDPYAYRVQPQDFDYDYGRDYDAARQQQQQGQGGRQGVYDMRLPRTSLEVQYDERGFDGMADRLGYFP